MCEGVKGAKMKIASAGQETANLFGQWDRNRGERQVPGPGTVILHRGLVLGAEQERFDSLTPVIYWMYLLPTPIHAGTLPHCSSQRLRAFDGPRMLAS